MHAARSAQSPFWHDSLWQSELRPHACPSTFEVTQTAVVLELGGVQYAPGAQRCSMHGEPAGSGTRHRCEV